MTTVTPNYENLGFSDQMGSELRALVESQLTEDLRFYSVRENQLKFDWSESCIEGHRASYLDGSVENFSGIAVFNEDDKLIAEGWMEFVNSEDFFLTYWEFLTTWTDGEKVERKKEVGIPAHVWDKIPIDLQGKWTEMRIKNKHVAPTKPKAN